MLPMRAWLSKDARKDAVLKAAGIRIVRLHVRSLPSVEEIRALLAASGRRECGGENGPTISDDSIARPAFHNSWKEYTRRFADQNQT